jgi:hypothetical protein
MVMRWMIDERGGEGSCLYIAKPGRGSERARVTICCSPVASSETLLAQPYSDSQHQNPAMSLARYDDLCQVRTCRVVGRALVYAILGEAGAV